MNPEERRGLLFVGASVALFSTTPVLIAWADPMNPFLKTWGRMAVAAVALGIAAWASGRRARSEQASRTNASSRLSDWPRFIGYGLMAALHFLFYIASLSYTTAAHALSIVYTAPIFVTILSALFLKEHIRRRQWAGVAVSVVGIAILAGLEPKMSWDMALGDGMALLAAISFGFYSVAGRYERERYPLLVYASRVYGVAALWLLPSALLTIPPTPSSAWDWKQVASVAALGLGPLAIGHTLYNASLRRVHATYVNIIASQEVTGGIILTTLLLGQIPTLNSLVGALISLIGIGLVLR